jgi:hypothetical protein
MEITSAHSLQLEAQVNEQGGRGYRKSQDKKQLVGLHKPWSKVESTRKKRGEMTRTWRQASSELCYGNIQNNLDIKAR